jgi:site-specific recombinase XerD
VHDPRRDGPPTAHDAALARYATTAPLEPAEPVRLTDLDARVAALLARSQAANTVRAYRSDLSTFAAWASAYGITEVPVPARNVARFLAWSADQGLKVSTIERRLAALSWLHRGLGAPPPSADHLVRDTMRGIRRELREDGRTRREPKAALTPDEIMLMVDACRAHLLDRPHAGDVLADEDRTANRLDALARRDISLLLLGYAGGMRRSELVNLRILDLDDRDDGLVVMLRWSKGDQDGDGRLVGIRPHPSDERYCPVRWTRAWLDRIRRDGGTAPSRLGPVFRRVHRSGAVQRHPISGQTVARVIKTRAAAAGPHVCRAARRPLAPPGHDHRPLRTRSPRRPHRRPRRPPGRQHDPDVPRRRHDPPSKPVRPHLGVGAGLPSTSHCPSRNLDGHDHHRPASRAAWPAVIGGGVPWGGGSGHVTLSEVGGGYAASMAGVTSIGLGVVRGFMDSSEK